VGRFKASFVKQFAGQELYSLLRRTQGEQPECIALVATAGGDTAAAQQPPEAGPGNCIGTLDVRLLDPSNPYTHSSWPDGVPAEAATSAAAAAAVGSSSTAGAAGTAAYVSNVVVAPVQRGRGLGRQLVAAGLAAAHEKWNAGLVYCHVETDNEVRRWPCLGPAWEWGEGGAD